MGRAPSRLQHTDLCLAFCSLVSSQLTPQQESQICKIEHIIFTIFLYWGDLQDLRVMGILFGSQIRPLFRAPLIFKDLDNFVVVVRSFRFINVTDL